jgi:cytoskeletal protein CcmA (bactofilin family)
MSPFRARVAFFSLGIIAVLGVMVPRVVAAVIDTSIFIVQEDDVVDEDVYVAADRGRVDGVIAGDLIIGVAGDLMISGRVEGDVYVAAGGEVTVADTGTVTGSVRGAVREVIVDGSVELDVAVAAVSTTVNGKVGRDVIMGGGTLAHEGSVGRDIRGWMFNALINGAVGHDVDIRVQTLEVGPDAVVDGDLVYRSTQNATTSVNAEVAGQFVRLEPRSPFVVDLYLTLATVLSFLAFLLVGILVIWLFRSTTPRAAAAIQNRPWKVLGVGFVAAVALPVLGTLILVLAAPFLAKAAVMTLLVLLSLLAFIFGPIPALIAFGNWALRRRGGLFGAFVLGATVWRLGVLFIPVVGLALTLAAMTWGVGGWLVAAWDSRRRHAPPDPLLPPAMVPDDDPAEVLANWVPPLPPEEPHNDDEPEPAES